MGRTLSRKEDIRSPLNAVQAHACYSVFLSRNRQKSHDLTTKPNVSDSCLSLLSFFYSNVRSLGEVVIVINDMITSWSWLAFTLYQIKNNDSRTDTVNRASAR